MEYSKIVEMEEENSYIDAEEDENEDEDSNDEEYEVMDVEMLDQRNKSQLKKTSMGIGLATKCYMCDNPFKSMEKVFAHYQKKHRQKNRQFLCPYPGCRLKGRPILSSKTFHFHLQSHYEPFKVRCALCRRKFLDEWTFRKHFYKHVPKNLLKCEFCEQEIWFKSSLEKHIKKFHKDPVPIKEKRKKLLKLKKKHHPHRIASKCFVCDQSFDSLEKVFLHLKAMHYKNNVFKCQQPSCRGMKFVNAKSFHFHLKSHFQPATHKCVACLKVFSDEWQFRKHSSQHKYRQSASFVLKKAERQSLRPPRPVKSPKIKIIRKIPSACYLCKTSFDSLENVFKHLKENHCKNNVYRCYQQNCYGKKFGKARRFFYHLKVCLNFLFFLTGILESSLKILP